MGKWENLCFDNMCLTAFLTPVHLYWFLLLKETRLSRENHVICQLVTDKTLLHLTTGSNQTHNFSSDMHWIHWQVSDCCLLPSVQIFSHIMHLLKTSFILMRWWCHLLSTRPTWDDDVICSPLDQHEMMMSSALH